MLARLDRAPYDLFAFEGALFVSTHGEDDNLTGEILRIPTDAGAPQVLARNQRNPHQVSVGGGFIYWLVTSDEQGSVNRMPIAGGNVTRVASTFIFAGAALTTDETHVYWLDKNKLMRSSHQRPGAEFVVEAGGVDDRVHALAVHSGTAYWLGPNHLWSVRISEKRAVEVAKGPEHCWGLAVDDTGVFWTDWGKIAKDYGDVWKIPVSTNKAELVQRPTKRPWGIALDQQFVYWVSNSETGVVARAPKAGGETQVLATAQSWPVHIGVDAKAIYWANAGSNEVMALNK